MTISLENVGSGFKRSVINDNFTAIQDEINNNLLDKAGGKALTGDLDFNSKSLLNASSVSTGSLTVNGALVVPTDLATSTLPDQTGNSGKHLVTNGSGAFWEEEEVEFFESVAELKAASLSSGRIVSTKQYYASPANTGYGAATYKIMTSAEFGATPDGYGDHVLSNGNVAKLVGSGRVNTKQVGAVGDGVTDDSAAIQAAIDRAVSGDGVVFFEDGTYLIGTSVRKDGINGLSLLGNKGHSIIDFQVDEALAFGDFTVDGSGYATQTSVTSENILVDGLSFEPVSGSGWDGSQFSNARPLSFSSCKNVQVTNCSFKDQHVAAVDFFAPCTGVHIHNNQFESSQEAAATYGVRPFCYVAPLDNLDETTGTLAYAAPTVYHSDINIYSNTFDGIGRGIVSWNVHNFDYSHNTFTNPVIRTISCTNWNFDGVLIGNKHIVSDNTTETLSTLINVGVGSERILISENLFSGSLSGTGVNASLKCIDFGGVNKDVVISNNVFSVVNASEAINCGPNVGVEICANQFLEATKSTGGRLIVFNESPAASPSFNFPICKVHGNRIKSSTRFLELNGEPPGTANPVKIYNNSFEQIMVNRVIVADSTSNWSAELWENDYIMDSSMNYVTNFGAGNITILRLDEMRKALVQVNTSGASTSINWRDYGGHIWYIVPDTAQTITDISGEFSSGQELTIQCGGNITFPQGASFKLDGGVDAVLGVNDFIKFVSRSGIWFELSRSLS